MAHFVVVLKNIQVYIYKKKPSELVISNWQINYCLCRSVDNKLADIHNLKKSSNKFRTHSSFLPDTY